MVCFSYIVSHKFVRHETKFQVFLLAVVLVVVVQKSHIMKCSSLCVTVPKMTANDTTQLWHSLEPLKCFSWDLSPKHKILWQTLTRETSHFLLRPVPKGTFIGKLKFGDLCWQVQFGICGGRNNSLQTCWQTIFVTFTFSNLLMLMRVSKLKFFLWRCLFASQGSVRLYQSRTWLILFCLPGSLK